MNFRFQILKFLANLNFAIFLLFLIAGISLIGTVIEQDQVREFYLMNYSKEILFHIKVFQVILAIGFDHIFKTWWFNFLLFIFGISLLSCTFLQQLPTFILSKRCYFYNNPSQFYKYPIKTRIINISNGIVTNCLKQNYVTFHQRHTFYSYKGVIGRFAPIIVHLSMNLILLGSILGALNGFVAQELIPKTEIFHIQNLLTINLLNYVPQFPTRLNDFWITYKKKNAINQFHSDLSILNNLGKEIQRSTISVNHPLQYNKVVYYQTDWDIIGLRVIYNDKIYQIPLISPNSLSKTLWFSWIYLGPTNGISVILNNTVGSENIYNNEGRFLQNVDVNEYLTFNNTIKLQLIDLIEVTGLQIKYDPGLQTIYVGFGILMLTVIVSYFSYYQIWVIRQANTIFIAGETNRAKLTLEKQVLNLLLNFTLS